ncbi:MAG TPA: hypothetical protein VIU86_04615, partial [Gaiellaceae bacterium]
MALRRLIAIAVLAAAGAAAGASHGATVPTGWLAGKTQISFGCPGPQRDDGPACNPWRTFANAQVSVVRVRADGTPVLSTRRLVVSDDAGAFRLRLAAGAYMVTPVKQPHALPTAPLQVRVTGGAVTRV